MYFLHIQTSYRKDSSTKFRSQSFEAHGYLQGGTEARRYEYDLVGDFLLKKQ